jgi:hypothetical protein
MGIIQRESADLFDDVTGHWAGVVDAKGREMKIHGPSVAQAYSFRQAIRKQWCRPYWNAARAELIARNPPVGNTGTVIYIDPTLAVNGTLGTFADPFNALPAAANWQGNTVLIAEMTTLNIPAAVSNGGNFSFNFGTYSRYDGSRVYDPRRLATLNALPAGNLATVASFSGVAAGSTAIFSGIRFTGARAAAAHARGCSSGQPRRARR